ncbi:hypothetical protein [Adhaeretor mobilis]|uniref:hypothetical protein n=1 Tax=Adhaeretor mobilis TaxID=1930276 RepID=UPI0011A65D59|nr:hypothetical protein [Adhaeretor mobilis]
MDYAELCGVNVTAKMDRQDLSDAIDAAFKADPKLKFKIAARRKKREQLEDEILKSLPPDAKKGLKKYNTGADSEYPFYLTVYDSGRNTVVDILQCEGARLDLNQRIALVDFLVPRVHDVVAGWDGKKEVRETELLWDESICIPLAAIRETRKIKIDEWQTKKYTSQIERKIAELKGKRR